MLCKLSCNLSACNLRLARWPSGTMCARVSLCVREVCDFPGVKKWLDEKQSLPLNHHMRLWIDQRRFQ